MKRKLLLILVCFINLAIYCQLDNTQNLFYSFFDNTVGQQNINFGSIFKEKYRKIKGNHNYFLTNLFQKGTITYRNQLFTNVKIKYDLNQDQIILNIRNQERNISIIPEKKLITNFAIKNINFINVENHGFLEQIFTSTSFSLLKKHFKTKKQNREKGYIYYTFKKEVNYFFSFNNTYYQIKSKKSFVQSFPNKKKTISNFYKKNQYLLKNDYDNFLIKLTSQLIIK